MWFVTAVSARNTTGVSEVSSPSIPAGSTPDAFAQTLAILAFR